MKFNKVLLLAASCAAFIAVLTIPTGAEKLTSSDYEYELLKDGTVEITAYISNSDTVNIPAEIDGYKVSCIGDTAFENNVSLVSVVIPESVTSIKSGFESLTIAPYGAFFGCTSLKSVALPENLTSIGAFAFMGCTALEEIELPQGLTHIGKDAFYGTALIEAQSEEIKYAEGWVIGSDKNINNCTLRDGTKGICDYTFKRCTYLESISFPEGIKYIGDGAFDGCSALTSVSIPHGVEDISRMVFMDCTKLKDVSIPSSVININVSAFTHCFSLVNIVIPEGVEFISDNVFNGCTALTSVSIPKSLSRVIFDAFSDCPSLAAVYCRELKGELKFNPNVFPDCATVYYDCEPIFNDSFSCYEKDGEVAVAAYIGKSVEVVIPRQIDEKPVTKIEGSIFNNRTDIKTMLIPDTITEISAEIFDDCIAMKTIYYGGTQEQWDAFGIGGKDSPLSSVQIVYNYGLGVMSLTENNRLSIIIVIVILVAAGAGFAGIFAIIDRKKNRR